MTYQRVLPLTFWGVVGDPEFFPVQLPFKTFFAPSRLHSPLLMHFTHVFKELMPTSHCQAVIARQGLPGSY